MRRYRQQSTASMRLRKSVRVALGAVATLIVAPLGVIAIQRYIDKATEQEPAALLEVTDLTVKNDGQSSPAIDVKVVNRGEKVSFVTRVGFVIRTVGDLVDPLRDDSCYQGAGYSPVTRFYDVPLPGEGGEDQTIMAKDVSQEIKADAVDRFAFRLAVPERFRSEIASTVGISRLFQLDVLIFHDSKATPMNAGTVLLAAPFPRWEYFDWNPGVSPPSACESENRRRLTRFLKLSGTRDDTLVTFARKASAGTLR
jgi:hypothetical protein